MNCKMKKTPTLSARSGAKDNVVQAAKNLIS